MPLVDFEVVVARLDEAAEGVSALSRRLSEDELHRAGRLHFDRDRRRYVVARARLRELLASRLNEDPRALEFVYGAQGKPALARGELRFNLSHCQELAVYAFATGCEVGVDVEALRALPEADGIAARFFSRCEYESYRALAPRERALGFFNCWTRKEAFVKALGGGLALPLERFAVTLAPGEAPRLLEIAGARGDGGWRLESFAPQPGFIAAVALAPG